MTSEGTLGEFLKSQSWEKIEQQWTPPVVVGHDMVGIKVPA